VTSHDLTSAALTSVCCCAGAAPRGAQGQSPCVAPGVLPIEGASGTGPGKRARRGGSGGGTQATGSIPGGTGTASHAAASGDSGAQAAAGMACATSAGPLAAAEEEEQHENIVEKRLKQNREAARRSRERKRHLKEELQQRLPILQQQHDAMASEVDKLIKCIRVCCISSGTF
jgi:hypothetical protein